MSHNIIENSSLKKTLLIIALCLLCIITSGCGSEELDRLAIVTAVQLDCGSSGTTDLDAEIIQINTGEQDTGSAPSISSSSGSDVNECLKVLDETESRKLYLGHMRLIVLSNKYLSRATREELDKMAEFFINNREIRFNTLIAAADSSSYKVLKASTSTTNNKGMDLTDEIRKNSVIYDVSDFINDRLYYHRDAEIPVLQFSRSESKTTVSISPGRTCILKY